MNYNSIYKTYFTIANAKKKSRNFSIQFIRVSIG